ELLRTVPELKPFKAKYHPPTTLPAATQPSEAALAAIRAPSDPPSSKGARTITVATDGSGEFKSLQSAIDAVSDNNTDRTTIHIKPGTYVGLVVVPRSKPNISFVGDDAQTTILSYALNVQDPIPPNVPPKMNGNGVIVLGDKFRAENITFRNTSGDH